MNRAEIFFYIVMPFTIVAIAWVAMRLHERSANKHHRHAGE